MYRKISVFDTTLRDGEQAPGNTMNFDQKIEMFKVIDNLGVDLIEVGFPSASEIDFQALKELSKNTNRAKICAFVRANKEDIDKTLLALENNNVQIQMLAVGSEIHLKYKRKITAEAAIEEAIKHIRYLRNQGIKDISIGLEDATRGSIEYLKRLINASIEAGATTIVIPDTVGCALPVTFGELVNSAKKWVGPTVKISIHCHNDLGLSLANTLAGIEQGADEVQTTLCGIGERAGNTSLEELVAVIIYNFSHYKVSTSIDATRLYSSCIKLIEILGISIANHKSILGEYAFSTEAGIHQHGILKNPITYEHVKPEDFGRKRQILIGRHSGRSLLRHKLIENDINFDEKLIDQIYKVIQNSDDLKQYNDSTTLMELCNKLKNSNVYLK